METGNKATRRRSMKAVQREQKQGQQNQRQAAIDLFTALKLFKNFDGLPSSCSGVNNPISIRISTDLFNRLDAKAAQKGIIFSDQFREALYAGMSERWIYDQIDGLKSKRNEMNIFDGLSSNYPSSEEAHNYAELVLLGTDVSHNLLQLEADLLGNIMVKCSAAGNRDNVSLYRALTAYTPEDMAILACVAEILKNLSWLEAGSAKAK
ncbi:hypothetical protein FO488_15945 [Geobacter sp. FeAm09]|uniref:hypothetical protein n=1 Tax=Geobacter sp. FeAm09 TaxID=2597769 RepID=UPI0011EDCA6E|nr:hypothetical protein [Geobacter sp. FeAm09]QEM69500.1 hypothetical protein FO488_15945 [Geobacter sp. FeAm09]